MVGLLAQRPLLTWSEDRGRDQEAENQTARRGHLRCHIPPPPRGPPTKSTPQKGTSSPGPRGPLARGSRLKGTAAFFQTHGPWGDRGAAPSGLSHTQLSSTRNPQLLPPPPRPLSVSLAAPSRTGDPRIPGDDASVVSQGGHGAFWLLSSATFSSCQGEDKKSNEGRDRPRVTGTSEGSAGQRLGLAPWVSSGGSRGSAWSGGSWSSGGGRGLGLL